MKDEPDKYYAGLFSVSPMTIGRWRRGIITPNYRTKLVAKSLKDDGAIKYIPDWLVINAKTNKE